MQCEKCKFAEWNRTKTGRRRPSGCGQCTWKGTFRIAVAASSFRYFTQPVESTGGYICRKKGDEWPTKECPVFQAKD